ncbi:hypothetical protein [Enterococcus faecalis]|uniref:hypothetical protein n=1 Tax=Enterococcus faecalis TaxID=1351 RepID=UPI0019261A4E|nr:hypothetical protein [Enterococcus faecalis]MBX8941965.1 hypothetical protein [Enterococcus faecalis]
MANKNRFEKFQGLDFDTPETKSGTTEAVEHEPNTKSESTETVEHEPNTKSNRASSFNITAGSVGMNKKPKNLTLYPSQIKRLEELSGMFNRSQSDLVGDFIDQVYNAYKD